MPAKFNIPQPQQYTTKEITHQEITKTHIT